MEKMKDYVKAWILLILCLGGIVVHIIMLLEGMEYSPYHWIFSGFVIAGAIGATLKITRHG